MLRATKKVKGPLVTTVQELRMCDDGLFLEYRDHRLTDPFAIDNPITAAHDDVFAQKFLDKGLEDYIIYKRQILFREPVFTDEVDNLLDDILSSFAVEYADSEYHQEDIMENLLRELKEKFKIERK